MTVPPGDRPFGRSNSGLGLSTSSLSAALGGAGSAAPTVFVAREAIVDRKGDVFAYELHLQAALGAAGSEQDDRASAAALVAAVIELGVERLANNRPVLLGVTPAILRDIDLLELTGENVGFVILEGCAEPAVVAQVAGFAAAGRLVALADYRPSIRADALLPHAHLVKIAVDAGSPEEIAERCTAARAFGAQLVADRIDGPATSQRCREAGFELYQGEAHTQPATVSGRGSRADQAATLTLLVQLSAAATSVDELERIVSSDLGLTVSTLHAVNSAAIALPNRITSIRQAIVLLGAPRGARARGAAGHDRALRRAGRAVATGAGPRLDVRRARTRCHAAASRSLLHRRDALDGGRAARPAARADRRRAAAGRRDLRGAHRRHRADRPDPESVISYEQARFGSVSAAQTVIRRDIASAYLNAVAFADGLTSALDGRRAA